MKKIKVGFALGPLTLCLHFGSEHWNVPDAHRLYEALAYEIPEGPSFEYGDTLFGTMEVLQVHNTPIGEVELPPAKEV